jgi:hypothetical protein
MFRRAAWQIGRRGHCPMCAIGQWRFLLAGGVGTVCSTGTMIDLPRLGQATRSARLSVTGIHAMVATNGVVLLAATVVTG